MWLPSCAFATCYDSPETEDWCQRQRRRSNPFHPWSTDEDFDGELHRQPQSRSADEPAKDAEISSLEQLAQFHRQLKLDPRDPRVVISTCADEDHSEDTADPGDTSVGLWRSMTIPGDFCSSSSQGCSSGHSPDTLRKCTYEELLDRNPEIEAGSDARNPKWSRGPGRSLQLRAGPDHREQRRKVEANGSLYECIATNVVRRSDAKIDKILEDVMAVPPRCSSGQDAAWTTKCGFPRIICVNVQVPDMAVNPFGRNDPGTSIVTIFRIKEETLRAAERDQLSPSMKMFKGFCEGPEGCLDSRKDRAVGSKDCSGVLKAATRCVNLDECVVGLNRSARREIDKCGGAKACLITKSGQMIKDPDGEWMELSIDVRHFALAARTVWAALKTRLSLSCFHVGFLIQGIEDDELPEGLIGDVVFGSLDPAEDARLV